MEASFRVKASLVASLIAIKLLIGSGCSTTASHKVADVASEPPATSSGSSPEVLGPPAPATGNAAEVLGPPEPQVEPIASPSASPELYGPGQVQVRPVVLVLGPGMARGFAAVGAIRALTEAKIPIGAVLGTETGALIGALYAMDAKINQLEWALLKFNEDVFLPKRLMPAVFDRPGRAAKLVNALKRSFGKRDVSVAKVPLRIALQLKDTEVVSVVDRGEVVGAIHAAVADPETFDPTPFNGVAAQSAANVRPFLIAEARALNIGPVVVIDALDEASEQQAASLAELKDADLVIRPDLKTILRMDFKKLNDAAFRGKKAVEEHMSEIRHLVGAAS